MSDAPRPNSGNTLPPIDREIETTLAEVRALDPELLAHPDTRQLIELGAQFGKEVTQHYGTPYMPKWASGTYEEGVVMTFHNGGEDGHTSVGPRGAGVPRNALLIALAVNSVASQEVYDPLMRATVFYAAQAHDRYQLCGRTLLPEGQGKGRGDERMSAEDARDRLLAAGGDPEVAQQVYLNDMATAYNPQTSTQNVNYEAWRTDPNNPATTRDVLEQELTAVADLFSHTTRRGALGAIEYSIESLCLAQGGRLIQQRLHALGLEPADIANMEQLLRVIGEDDILLEAFTRTVPSQATFSRDHLRYSDHAIRAACGQGIDDLFPGRIVNSDILAGYAEVLQTETPLAVWQDARTIAGY